MKKNILTTFLFLSAFIVNAQVKSYWGKINTNELTKTEKTNKQIVLEDNLLFQLDESTFKNYLIQVEDKKEQNTIQISVPNANGDLEQFIIKEESNFAPELQAKYPEIRSYKGIGITDPSATLFFSFSPLGMESMVVRADKDSEFLESYSKSKSIYKLITSKNRSSANLPIACSTDDASLDLQLQNKIAKIKANDKVFRTFRLALSCNAEYTNFYGGTIAGALAGMNASMTRINGVLGKELAVKFEIIANNDLLIYLDPLTDPYSDATTGADNANGATWNLELQKNLTTTIGNSGYDVGHLLSGSGGGGNAGCIGCICTNPTTANPYGKGSAWSAPSNNTPQGPNFDIDVVAHEMGHQLGGNHTFSYKIEGRGANIEPGSGSTIMGYAGVTSYNVQAHSDDYYSVNSILQIQSNLASKTCSTNVPISNNPPVISAGLDYSIPKGTPFILKGTGSDPEGDSITYSWEENDNSVTQIDANSICFPTKADGPLFRSLIPSSSPIRYMPLLKDVLSNTLTTTWESVSNIERTLNFSFTGRDNAILGTSQTNTDDMIVHVVGTVGPFSVTSQNTDNIGWSIGGSQTITWNVNGAETLPGASNVNIKLSTDGGLTYPILLVSNTPNDGSEIITVPNVEATNCRLLIEPTANIFYAINSKVFAVGYTVSSECNTYTFTSTPITIPDNVSIYSTRTVDVPSTLSTIVDVNVAIAIQHTFIPDVQIEIVSPQGTTVQLLNNGCGSNLNLLYDDSGTTINCSSTVLQNVIPKNPLSAFNGQDPANTWTLRFRDTGSGDIGTLKSASVTICTKKYTKLGLNNLSLSNYIMYPNPSKGQFNIRFSSPSENDVKILVHDLLGRKIFENKYKKNGLNFNENIQLKNTTSGFYLLTVIDGDRKEERKIMIE